MKLLITGASGFIGSGLVRALGRHTELQVRLGIHQRPLACKPELPPHQWECRQADLNSAEDCLRLCEGVDAIIHAAGGVGSAAVNSQQSMQRIVGGLVQTSQLLNAAWANRVGRVLIFGSSTGYPLSEEPFREEEMFCGHPPEAYFGYGWMRRYLEQLGQFVQRQSSTEVVTVRSSAVYGPWDNFDPQVCHVIPALIRKAVDKTDPFEVWGTGQEQRDFIFIDDFARGTLQALLNLPAGQAVNLATGRPTTVAELAHAVCRAAEHQPREIRFLSDRPPLPQRLLNIGKAQELLDFETTVELHQGLRQTVEWFLSHTSGDGH